MSSNHVEEITAQIRDDIQSGRLGRLAALPTRRALAKQFGTTVDTISKVLHNLEIEGLVVAGEGTSMLVNPPRARVTTNDETFRDVMADLGYNVQVEHLKPPRIIEASAADARDFGVAEGTPIVERMRREIVNGIVYRYSRKLYLAELVPTESLRAMRENYAYNVREVLEQQRPLGRIEERIIARVITSKDEAEILGTVKGAPVLEQKTINYDQQGRVIFISTIMFNGNMFVKKFDYEQGNEPISTIHRDENY